MAKRRPYVPDTQFPHVGVSLRAVQPDYEAWQAVRIGMTRKEVVALLGRTRCEQFVHPTATYSVYGYLQLPLLPLPRLYSFVLGFNDDGKVFTKSDPFDGIFSADGRPSKPKIFTPPDGAVFSHYPRLLDMRWYPASGRYPMRYDIEIGFTAPLLSPGAPWSPDTGPWSPYSAALLRLALTFPYYVMDHVAGVPGRFRVRGENQLGVGEWSDYRYFAFTR